MPTLLTLIRFTTITGGITAMLHTTITDGEYITIPGDMATVMPELATGVMAITATATITGVTTETPTTTDTPVMWPTTTAEEIPPLIIIGELPEAVI